MNSAEKEHNVNGATTMIGEAEEVIADPEDGEAMVGRRLGPYRLIEKLGSGAFAQVFRAQADGGHEVALKLVLASGDQQRRRFEEVINEAMASSAVHHPHVVSCLSYGSDDEHLYIVMELAESGDTHQLVSRGGPLDHRRILKLADQCVRGLEAIHAAGLIHRDIKPSNIMLDAAGDARIGDLGLVFPAALAGEGMSAAGTPAYMSREQARSERIDARTDIYSLGATMYFWATGYPPYKGGSALETIGLVITGDIPDVHKHAPETPPELVELIRIAMDPRRERRFASAALMRDAIAQVAAGARPQVDRPASASLKVPSVSRSAWRAPVVTVASVMVILLVIGWLMPPQMASQVPTQPPGAPPARSEMPLTAYVEHRVLWVGDPLAPFIEHGDVRYARAGRQAIFAGGTSLTCLDGSALLRPLAMAVGGFSVELAFHIDDLAQQGPARILACGLNHRLVNLMIGQSGSRLEVRCRTTTTNTDGTRPHLVTAEGSLTVGGHHLMFVRQGEDHSLWLDGEKVASVVVPGSLSAWDPTLPLAFGDEARGGFPWSGRIDQFTFVTAPLDAVEIARRFAVWREERQQ